MSQQTIFICDRCGARFSEVKYDYESRIAMKLDYHWDSESTGHHSKGHSFDLCKKCSDEFERFIGNGKRKNLSE
jgi:hypothetical protein